MTSARRFAEGDRVSYPLSFAGAAGQPAALTKVHSGVVVDVGARGVQIRFDDDRMGTKWIPAGKLRLSEEPQVKVVERAKPDQGACVEVLLPPPDRSETKSEAKSDLDAWREMGRGLVESARQRLALMDDHVSALRDELTVAQDERERAKADLNELLRAVGGGS